MASRRFDWRLLPLLLVLLTCNAETRQVVTQTIQYIVSGVCHEISCASQTTQGHSLETLSLVLPAQSGLGLVPDSPGLGLVLALLVTVLFWVAAALPNVAGWVDSRAPPRGVVWPTP